MSSFTKINDNEIGTQGYSNSTTTGATAAALTS